MRLVNTVTFTSLCIPTLPTPSTYVYQSPGGAGLLPFVSEKTFSTAPQIAQETTSYISWGSMPLIALFTRSFYVFVVVHPSPFPDTLPCDATQWLAWLAWWNQRMFPSPCLRIWFLSRTSHGACAQAEWMVSAMDAWPCGMERASGLVCRCRWFIACGARMEWFSSLRFHRRAVLKLYERSAIAQRVWCGFVHKNDKILCSFLCFFRRFFICTVDSTPGTVHTIGRKQRKVYPLNHRRMKLAWAIRV